MKITSVSKIDQVREAILTEIALGRIEPGERLVETRLSEQLGVSQATVNAALQDLHNLGVVTKRLNRSTSVNRYGIEDVQRLFEVRLALEPLAASALAARWSPEVERILLGRLEDMKRAAAGPDVGNWCIADYRFHQEVYHQSGNQFLIQAGQAIAMVPFVYILCEGLRRLPSDDYAMMTTEHHAQILAFGKGPKVAERETREFIRKWLNWLLDMGHVTQPAAGPHASTQSGRSSALK